VNRDPKFRYEIKLVLPAVQIALARSWILSHRDAYCVAYPSRRVNNIYFDTYENSFQNAHLAGVFFRSKLRFRWYGETWKAENGQLELKSRIGKVGEKAVKPIHSTIDIMNSSWKEIIASIEKDSSDLLPVFTATRPVLISHYFREYYQSADGVLRITLDSNMKSYGQAFGFLPNLSTLELQLDQVIVELKASSRESQRISDALLEFPVHTTQFSKFLDGVENIF
jgi:hypothetical protein